MIAEIRAVAHRAYRWENPRERHRALIFMVRGLLHRRQLRELYDFFHETEVRRALYERNPFPLEQATRAFFYAGSTVRSRIKLIKEHYAFLEERLKAPDFIELGLDRAYEIWRSAETDMEWNAYLKFEPGQRKEGLLSVMMDVDGTHLYQIMFWIDQRDGVPTLVIGAMQGPNTENAQDFVVEDRHLTTLDSDIINRTISIDDESNIHRSLQFVLLCCSRILQCLCKPFHKLHPSAWWCWRFGEYSLANLVVIAFYNLVGIVIGHLLHLLLSLFLYLRRFRSSSYHRHNNRFVTYLWSPRLLIVRVHTSCIVRRNLIRNITAFKVEHVLHRRLLVFLCLGKVLLVNGRQHVHIVERDILDGFSISRIIVTPRCIILHGNKEERQCNDDSQEETNPPLIL